MKIESKLKFLSYSALAFTFIVLLIFSMLAIPDEYIDNKNGSNFEALAQTLGTMSPGQLKVLIDNFIQTLQSGDINGTITRLKGAEQEIGAIPKNNENYASVQVVLILLLTDAIKSLDNGDNSETLIYLNLAEQELGRILLYTSNSQNIPPGPLTYLNHRYKIRINYQHNWIMDGSSYPTGAGGMVITSFYLPDANHWPSIL